VSNRAERRRERRVEVGPGGSGSKVGWILGGAGVLAVAIVAWNLFSTALDSTARAPMDLEYGSPAELLELAQGISYGDPDAPIILMEFADFQCPSCLAFFQQVKPLVDLSYIQSGAVRMVLYDFPLIQSHPNAFLAARAARCAGDQGNYWGYHDRLFLGQSIWSRRADPAAEFIDYAAEIGLDRGAFTSCLRSDRHAEVVTANMILGNQLGVQGTPTLLVDAGIGRAIRLPDFTIESIRRVVDEALASLASADAPGGV